MKPDSPHTEDIPTMKVLEGLGRLHPFVLVTSADGKIAWMNERLRANFENDSSGAFVPKQEQLGALRDGLCSQVPSKAVELQVEAKDGTQMCVDANAVAMTPGEPDDRHYVVIARPQAERDEAARALEGTISVLSQILESSPNGVIATDHSGYISYVNSQATHLLGRDRRDLVGRPVAMLVAQFEKTAEVIEKLRHADDWEREEIEFTGPSRNLWLSVSTRPLRNDAGHSNGIVWYLQDISERRLVQAELERKNQEMEAYVDSAAHDLRSPLVSLLGFTRLLREDYETQLDEQGHRFLFRIEEAGQTMDALIHDLLELSRIRKPSEARPFLDPRSVLEQLAAEFKLRLEEQGIELSLPTAPPIMQIDGTRLYQVLSNLVGNATKHGFDDAEQCSTPQISIEIHERENDHEVVVSDNGRGLPEEEHERVFQVFQTGKNVCRSKGSHGIGLAIVKKIAEAHGGRVWLASQPGQGASFHVLLPAPEAPELAER